MECSGVACGSRAGRHPLLLPPGAGFNSSGSDVKVEHRPVTRDGIEGVRLGTAGPNRQVQDVSYYTGSPLALHASCVRLMRVPRRPGMLQRKCEEIVNEMERLNKEAEQMDADQVAHAAYEKRYEELVQSVRELEGTLADHNLALDKARSGSDLNEQQRYCDMVRVRCVPAPFPDPRTGLTATSTQERNADLAQEADQVFRERQRREEAIESLQKQAESMRRQEQDRMASLPPDLRQRVEVRAAPRLHCVGKGEPRRVQFMALTSCSLPPGRSSP